MHECASYVEDRWCGIPVLDCVSERHHKIALIGKWASRKSPINDRKTTGAKTGGRRDEAGSRAGASMRRGVVGGVVPKMA